METNSDSVVLIGAEVFGVYNLISFSLATPTLLCTVDGKVLFLSTSFSALNAQLVVAINSDYSDSVVLAGAEVFGVYNFISLSLVNPTLPCTVVVKVLFLSASKLALNSKLFVGINSDSVIFTGDEVSGV